MLAWLVAAFGVLLVRSRAEPAHAGFSPPRSPEPAAADAAPLFVRRTVHSGAPAFVHSPALIELPGGGLRAFWYGGSFEASRDSAVFTATLDVSTQAWGPADPIVTPESLLAQTGRYVKTLGNPVALVHDDGRLWLFYVIVVVGKWSGSSVVLQRSNDGGASWEPARRLITSPLLNLGTLVKGPPLRLESGGVGLPVYHELGSPFGEFLTLDRSGRVVATHRMSSGGALQPVVVPSASRAAVGLLRSRAPSPRRVLRVTTGDGGHTWSDARPTEVPNPDSAVGALRLFDGSLLMVFNDGEGSRTDLSLAHSKDDGLSWNTFQRLESGPRATAESEHSFAYPYPTRSRDGHIHVVYSATTEAGCSIEEVEFNEAWLSSQL
jgi:predicted neuraminidase